MSRNDDRKPDAWMPFVIGKYLADTTHLSTEQHGAYFLLLIGAWMRKASLPNDEAQLAQIARLSPARWRQHAAVLLAFWDEEGDRLVQKKLTEEYARAVALSERQSANGKRGGRPPKENPDETHGFRLGYATDKAKPNPDESPIPIPINKQEQKQQRAPAARFSEFWSAYPIRKGRKEATKVWQRQHCDDLADLILAHVARMVANDDGWKRGYAPHPTTYLRGERWNDEPAAAPQARAGPTGLAPSRQYAALAGLQNLIEAPDEQSELRDDPRLVHDGDS